MGKYIFLLGGLILLNLPQSFAIEFLRKGTQGEYHFRCITYRSGKVTVMFNNGNVVVKGTPTKSYFRGEIPYDRAERFALAFSYAKKYCRIPVESVNQEKQG